MRIVITAVISFFLFHVTGAAVACEDPNTLRFALVPRTDPARQLEIHRPFVAYLESVLKRKIEIVQPSSYGAVGDGLVAGNIDVASMGPASYALARNRDDTILPFVTWTMRGGQFVPAGAHSYHSLLIARRGDAISDIRMTRGRPVALTDPASTSGSVVPREEFGNVIGRRIEDHFSRVIYTGSHDRSVVALKRGDVDLAFVASEHLDEVIRQGRVSSSDFTVLWKSEAIPHDPFVYRGRLCASLRERILRAFLADSPQAKNLLESLKGERFVPVNDGDYQSIRMMMSR